MFKYLWIVMLGIVALIFVGVVVADIVQCSKENYAYFIKDKRGNWSDVILETLADLSEVTWVFLIVMVGGIAAASLIMFVLSFGGAE